MTSRETLRGVILDESVTLTLDEVCEVCGIQESVVIEMVQEGVAEPLEADSATLEFSGFAVTRLMTARRLQRDLHINLPGVALALELLDELTELRQVRRK